LNYEFSAPPKPLTEPAVYIGFARHDAQREEKTPTAGL
jgi:hypothetical protein